MPRFYPLKVAFVGRAADDAVQVSLTVPEQWKDVFAFQAGQHVPLRHSVAGRIEYRTYSIVSGPGDATLDLGVRVQPGGGVSTRLGAHLAAGDALEVGAPAGRFVTALDPARTLSYAAFAAGSGITPILSLAKHILVREPHSRLTVVYGNRSIANTMFLEEVLALKNRYLSRFAVHFVMSREPQQTECLNGRVNGDKVRELSHRIESLAYADEYFVCGPGAMVDEVRDVLQDLNAAAAVRVERFAVRAAPTVGLQGLRKPAAPIAAPLATISVTMDGRVRQFPMSPSDASVLDAAERAGLALPFSCRAGICATCRTRITAGAAVMSHNIGLERWEIEAGFVLCCQARPTTKTLAISYDEK